MINRKVAELAGSKRLNRRLYRLLQPSTRVLLNGNGAVVGRFNLYNVEDGTAEVGYRVAEQVAGWATSTLRKLC